jgi:hypothetical protein
MSSVSLHKVRTMLRSAWAVGETSRRFPVGATIAYFALIVVAHVFHENWRDEVHCWIVGHHARGLWDLLFGIRRYDGHPFLWYWVLHLASRITPSIVGLHVVTIVFATAAAYLWLCYAPFPRLIRLLGVASYYLVFEYTVICRGYVLGLFLLFSFAALYDRRFPRHILLFTLLGLLAATSVYGTIIALSMALFLTLQEVRSWWARGKLSSDAGTRRPRLFLIGLFEFAFAIGIVVWTTMPPKDEFFAPVWHTELGLPQVIDALLRWWIAVLPVARDTLGWDVAPTGLWLMSPGFLHVMPWLAASALLLCLMAMLDTWPAAVAYAAIVVLMSLFQETRNLGDVRHWGHFFVALLACLWLALQRGSESRLGTLRRLVTTVGLGAVLLLQDVTGAVFLVSDVKHPFSGSSEAAQIIERAGLRDAAFVGSHDHLASAVMGIIDRPFASGNNGEVGYSVVFHNRRHTVNTTETFRLARRFLVEQPRRPVVLVMSWDLPTTAVPRDLKLEKFGETRPAMHAEETYRLYRVGLNELGAKP